MSGDAIDADRVAAVIARVPGWSGRARVLRALAGGTTNRNLLVDVDGDRFVVRLPGPNTERLEIDRECERIAASRAADLGDAPEVLGIFEGCLVTRFAAGSNMAASDFETPAVLTQIASMLRRFHRSDPLDHEFDAFAVPARHRHSAEVLGVPTPDAYARVEPIVTEIATAFGAHPDAPCPCHNDLLRANFLRDGARLWLLDWEYAGMNDRTFDLGNLAVNNDLSVEAEEHLVATYFGGSTNRNAARVRLMKIVSDAREAMWAVLQQGISPIDFDYGTYTTEHFDRLFTNASQPAYRTDLAAAAAPAVRA